MPVPFAIPIQLLSDQRSTLEQWVRDQKTPKRQYLRARVVLLAADGHINTSIAEKLDYTRDCVVEWRSRFVEQGLDGLSDLPRSGRPSKFSP